MRRLGISATTPRLFVRTTRREEDVLLADLISQAFSPGEPKWR
jgi:hypothetical protein